MTDPEIQGATGQVAVMLAFLAASAALITFVGGVDAVQHAAVHLFRGAQAAAAAAEPPPSNPIRDLTAEVARDAVPPSSPRSNARLDA